MGLLARLLIVYRPIVNHLRLRRKGDFTGLMMFYVFSAVPVVLFFAFGLLYAKNTHLR
jgi:nitric oxide reductase subunit B